ncbi:Creatinine amidohydrolase/Fe(II)-dependent formamide hydrolase involved in riboflavin and F420 biosynthesis [Duganella sacchari]|uniref:Creatinine amidohydrolase/Fe(II)-dependent formamide hydrolase involved in riboflavin and F420 biosynthesis n=1 Tax=Duganella sacchari TaxID=551987 RepID=A0A1M7R3W2_9BURK|nr:creatininase family protein [Duganella sacchari]SHN39608.1 Creatinine amidohydrolase/Fe(II)-dependent formamide hydrolase involved in riboflavin and F420 biosynthesis [Duganella sacchari]
MPDLKIPAALAACLLVGVLARPAVAAEAPLMLEEMTSTELRARIDGGATTAIIPIGGTEQSGPYIALGKHNVRAVALAKMIAQKLGNAVVAPVVSYVPEGSITPPAGHMRFAGTLSIPEQTFEDLLVSTGQSLRQHGFRHIVLIGDHGGYQKSETKVAQRLNKAWARDGKASALALLAYYDVTQDAYVADLQKRGYSKAEIGLHAGLADAALMLATDKSLVRSDALARGPSPTVEQGVRGDARRATAELGKLGVQRIVDTSVAAITEFAAHGAPSTSVKESK